MNIFNNNDQQTVNKYMEKFKLYRNKNFSYFTCQNKGESQFLMVQLLVTASLGYIAFNITKGVYNKCHRSLFRYDYKCLVGHQNIDKKRMQQTLDQCKNKQIFTPSFPFFKSNEYSLKNDQTKVKQQ
eukprot:403374921